MRNPNRIDPILKLQGEIWHKYPDLRLCQIISNAADLYKLQPRCRKFFGSDLYYMEDDQIQAGLYKHNCIEKEAKP